MKLLGIVNEKDFLFYKKSSLAGYIFPLKDWAVDYVSYFTLEEIKKKKKEFPNKLFFVIINRMIFNQDLAKLEEIIQDLAKIKIDGLFYYDNAILEIINHRKINIPLYFNKTHMVTNANTLNFYHDYGVKGAYLSNEITLEEIKQIRKHTKIELAVMLMGFPTVAMSHRKLITNDGKANQKKIENPIKMIEPISKQEYLVSEEKHGTSFHYGKRMNASICYKELKEIGIDYGILVQDDLDSTKYLQLVDAFLKNQTREIDAFIGRNRCFLYRKTIYRVK